MIGGTGHEISRDASSWNLPNALTVGRLLLVPVFVVVAWVGLDRGSEAWQTWAAIVFGAAAVTDLTAVCWSPEGLALTSGNWERRSTTTSRDVGL